MRYGLGWDLDCSIIISSTSLSGNLKWYRTNVYFPITKEGSFLALPNQSIRPKYKNGAWRFSACSNPISRPLPLKVPAYKVLFQCRQALNSSHNNCTLPYTILHKSFSVYIIYMSLQQNSKNVPNSCVIHCIYSYTWESFIIRQLLHEQGRFYNIDYRLLYIEILSNRSTTSFIVGGSP